MNIDLKDLSLEEKIGQLFIVNIEGNKITENTKKLIRDYKVGGIILYRKNFSTYAQMVNLINELKKINSNNKIPLFISIDQEGGRVNRLPKEIVNLKSAKEIASTENIDLVRKSGDIIGKILNESGFNMNFAPVLDIQNFPDNHPIGNRCYGNNVEDVSKYAIEVMKSIEKNKIISVIKHFPGHGATKNDSHMVLPIVKKNIKELENHDMKPFKNAIDNGADAMMISHLLIKEFDKYFPVSLSSKFIAKYIRKKLRYNGLLITDDINMKAVNYIYGYKYAAKKAINAGNDIIMMKFSYNKKVKIIKRMIKLTSLGIIKEYKIDKKIRRIINIKEKYDITDDIVKGCDINKINSEVNNINNSL